jgi:hypothetical protein
MDTPQYQTLKVQVKDKILWIGSDAYPVRNIARAQARELVPPKRKSPVGPFLKSIAKWVAIGFIASIIATVAHLGSIWDALIWLVVLAFVAIAIRKMIRELGQTDKTYYSLVIETAGTPREALVSDNEALIDEVISQIMKAINGEAVDWSQTVNNYHLGDVINQHGPNSVGKINA